LNILFNPYKRNQLILIKLGENGRKTKITSFNNIPSPAPENKKKKNKKSNELQMTLEKKNKSSIQDCRVRKKLYEILSKIFDF